MEQVKTGLQIALFLGLTLCLYCLLALTLPFFQEPQGLLVMNEWADVSRSASIHVLMFGSAAACALLGALLLDWVPAFTPGLMANLWSVTYFFIWIDPVLDLCVESQSLRYLWALGLGVLFIYVFFLLAHVLDEGRPKATAPAWGGRMVNHWLWGWMGFYFGLSCLMAYDSLWQLPARTALAFGSLALCFLNYLLCLYLKKSAAPEMGRFSLAGRRFFTGWFSLLVLLWVAERFFGV